MRACGYVSGEKNETDLFMSDFIVKTHPMMFRCFDIELSTMSIGNLI